MGGGGTPGMTSVALDDNGSGRTILLMVRASNPIILYRKKEYIGPYIGSEDDGP